MKKLVFFLLIIALIISSIAVYIISDKNRLAINQISDLKEKEQKLQSSIDYYEYLKVRSDQKNYQMLFSENVKLPNIILSDNNNTIPIKNLVSNKPKLVYRFYEETCIKCVEDELDIIKKISDSIGQENILILSSYGKNSSLNAIINRKKITSPHFNYNKSLNISIEEDEYYIASFFLLNQNLNIDFVYKTGGDQNINHNYYKRIIKYFKDL